METLALQLLLAHVIGDFVFQPTKWVKDKKQKKQRSKYLYAHIGVHALALLVMLKFDLSLWKTMGIILLSHYLIDVAKLNLNKRMNANLLFVLDQMAHLSIIAALSISSFSIEQIMPTLFSKKFLGIVLALLCLINVSSILMKLIMSQWQIPKGNKEDSLKNAGKYIGILERLFVFGFILLDLWQGIGWLLAAKSIFRFGDLSRAKDRKLTEYILIGTMLSFGLAIIIGLLYLHFIE